LRKIQCEFGVSILFITHDLGVVAGVADRVAVMKSGQIVESGGVNEILLAPQMDYTRALIAAIPKVRPLEDRAAVHAMTQRSEAAHV